MRTLFFGVSLLASMTSLAADGNRLTYLDEPCDPYYVHAGFPKLITPQWVGDEGVEAVVVLAIDDMRDTKKYETYLRPILERLKKIDGRAPVSIMTCSVDPKDPQLQIWLKEGLSIDVHTVDHPCPLLQGGDLAKAKSTYDRCVDLLNEIPGNKPVAFRMPCCDSLNTPSPRFWTEIFDKRTEKGHFLSIDTSVFQVFTPADKELPRDIVFDKDGSERFKKYIPFESFVNTIENHPYPYVIGRTCWEFPCMVPSDWEAQHIQKPNNPKTVEDMKAALDAVVIKRGVFNLVFHPHGWIRNDQVIELIDHAVEKHGKRVKFLTFPEALARLNKNLLAETPLHDDRGRDNGVRLLDVNGDGFMDVVMGNGATQKTRVWDTASNEFRNASFPTRIVKRSGDDSVPSGAHFGVIPGFAKSSDDAVTVVGPRAQGWSFNDGEWIEEERAWQGIPFNSLNASSQLRDLDGDGSCELIEANWAQSNVLKWDAKQRSWERLSFVLPDGSEAFDKEEAGDIGLRFVDVNGDGRDDVLFSNEQRYSLYVFKSMKDGWSEKVLAGKRGEPTDKSVIPMIVRGATNNGAWFHSGHLWIQNEDTNRLPNLVDRLSFEKMLEHREGEAPAEPN